MPSTLSAHRLFGCPPFQGRLARAKTKQTAQIWLCSAGEGRRARQMTGRTCPIPDGLVTCSIECYKTQCNTYLVSVRCLSERRDGASAAGAQRDLSGRRRDSKKKRSIDPTSKLPAADEINTYLCIEIASYMHPSSFNGRNGGRGEWMNGCICKTKYM